MIEYVDIVNKIQDDIKEQHTIAVAFNNHFAGFSPQSANSFFKVNGQACDKRLDSGIRTKQFNIYKTW